ncbi:hypothetical protein HF086_016630 [Spodoptera exigua]|uniref:Uncharacterized protein n=1 Tax=Spodoptera exigua TaxID=7107 RepID=A0A922MCU3_SPOEX|nr:hypothetical protein HF086_016630 [Spodoptera exigua]
MEFQNITLRKNKTTANESLNLSFLSTTSDYLAKSLPDLSTGHLFNEDIERYKEEIGKLKEQLEIAHLEIENLTIVNNNLQRLFCEQKQKNEQLKQICTNSPSTLKKTNSISKQKACKKLQRRTSNLNMSCTDLDLISDCEVDPITTDGAGSRSELKLKTYVQNLPRSSEMSQDGAKQQITQEIPRTCSMQQIDIDKVKETTEIRPQVMNPIFGCITITYVVFSPDKMKNAVVFVFLLINPWTAGPFKFVI